LETAAAKAQRLIAQKLSRLNWTHEDSDSGILIFPRRSPTSSLLWLMAAEESG
jgi:hypothetical protein